MKQQLTSVQLIQKPIVSQVNLQSLVETLESTTTPSSIKILVGDKIEYTLQSQFCRQKKSDQTEKQQQEFLQVLHKLIYGITRWSSAQVAELSMCMVCFTATIKNHKKYKTAKAVGIQVGQKMAMKQFKMHINSVLPAICKGLGISYAKLDTLMKMLSYETRQTANVGNQII